MELDIKEMNRERREILPADYTVTHRLQKSLLTKEYMVICRTEDNSTALIWFDGISETPMMIDKYYDMPNSLSTSQE